jgi:hypothetical protein
MTSEMEFINTVVHDMIESGAAAFVVTHMDKNSAVMQLKLRPHIIYLLIYLLK